VQVQAAAAARADASAAGVFLFILISLKYPPNHDVQSQLSAVCAKELAKQKQL
jgi:hypothetical protein